MAKKPELPVKLRWMDPTTDLGFVEKIEQSCFQSPWTSVDIENLLKNLYVISLVACAGDDIPIGYMMFQVNEKSIYFLRFAVHGDFKQKGVGSQMMDRMKSKLSFDRRTELRLVVSESNAIAQMFLKTQGFEAQLPILKNYYDGTDDTEDGYLMVFSLHDDRIPLELSERELKW